MSHRSALIVGYCVGATAGIVFTSAAMALAYALDHRRWRW